MEFRKMVTITRCTRQQETLMYRTVLWTLWERERGGRACATDSADPLNVPDAN